MTALIGLLRLPRHVPPERSGVTQKLMWIGAIALLSVCHLSAAGTPPDVERSWFTEQPAVTQHFEFVTVGAVPDHQMAEIAQTLADYRAPVLEHLSVEKMHKVTVKVWGDRSAFERAFVAHENGNPKLVGGYIDAISWEVRIFAFDRPLGLTAVHEFTHLVSIARNATIDNNPRWLWESVAIYESGRPPVPPAKNLTCFSEAGGPTLESLNEHPLNIYRVGYYLLDFVVHDWGRAGVVRLIETNGNLKDSLGVTQAIFEKRWLDYMREHSVPISSDRLSNC